MEEFLKNTFGFTPKQVGGVMLFAFITNGLEQAGAGKLGIGNLVDIRDSLVKAVTKPLPAKK